jgi:hypothetical protein
MNQQQGQMVENSTKVLSFIVSSSSLSPVHASDLINAIYIIGVIFMIIVFLVLLWINLYSQRCWCWHDTPLINRFNRQWLMKRSLIKNTNMPSTENQRQRRSSNDD